MPKKKIKTRNLDKKASKAAKQKPVQNSGRITSVPMTFIFISNLHLKLAEPESIFTLNSMYHLVADKELPKNWAKGTGMFALNTFGSILLETLTRYPCYIITMEDEEVILKELEVPDVENLSMLQVITLQAFNLYTWVVKDNSVNLGGYFYHNSSSRKAFWRSRNVTYSNCHGLYIDTVFTMAELKEAEDIFLKIFEISDTTQYKGIVPDPKAAKIPGITYLNANEESYNSHNRITRALMFLESARSSTHLPLKIAFYVGMLECLFSLEPGEISHRVAERVALYIGTDKDSRKIIYKKVKTAYDVRSKYIHGQTLSKGTKTKDQLQTISSETDDLLRQVIGKVINRDVAVFKDMTEDQLREWYADLVFT